jgi:hypothetical protein
MRSRKAKEDEDGNGRRVVAYVQVSEAQQLMNYAEKVTGR